MKGKTLYTEILGIKYPWEIIRVDLNVEEERVDVYVEWPRRKLGPCPSCEAEGRQTLCRVHDRRRERHLRHLDTCHKKTIIHSNIPRASCPLAGQALSSGDDFSPISP